MLRSRPDPGGAPECSRSCVLGGACPARTLGVARKGACCEVACQDTARCRGVWTSPGEARPPLVRVECLSGSAGRVSMRPLSMGEGPRLLLRARTVGRHHAEVGCACSPCAWAPPIMHLRPMFCPLLVDTRLRCECVLSWAANRCALIADLRKAERRAVFRRQPCHEAAELVRLVSTERPRWQIGRPPGGLRWLRTGDSDGSV